MKLNLDKSYTFTLKSMPRGRDYNLPLSNSCNIPWKHATIDLNGNVLICRCDGWLPIPVGSVDDFNSLEEIWASPTANLLQQNILEKKFTWCAVEHCGITKNDIIANQYTLHVNIDESCNLSCPSCRREHTMLLSGPTFDKKLQQVNQILLWLEKFNYPIEVLLSGNGDPLASNIIRPIIKNYIPKPNQTFVLKSNGLLLEKQLSDSTIKNSISRYSISVDAATKDTYEKVRRLGKWEILVKNLEWLKLNRGSAKVTLDFVVQRDNLHDMKKFITLCNEFGFNGTFVPLNDWGTWNSTTVINPDAYTIANGTFLDHNVANQNHPEYNTFVSILKDINNNKPDTISVSGYFQQFV